MTALTSHFVHEGSDFLKWLRNLLRAGAPKAATETETKTPREEGVTIPPAFL